MQVEASVSFKSVNQLVAVDLRAFVKLGSACDPLVTLAPLYLTVDFHYIAVGNSEVSYDTKIRFFSVASRKLKYCINFVIASLIVHPVSSSDHHC